MTLLAIDIGTYSIKFYETKPVAGKLKLINYEEVHLSELNSQTFEELTLQEKQFTLIARYLKKRENPVKIISHLDHEMMTTRYLTLPVNQKRKAQLMIPFQLEDHLPYSLSNTHITSFLHKEDKNHFAQVCVTEKDFFAEYYHYQKERSILPAIVSTDLFAIQSYLLETKNVDTFCLVDIGHHTTKAYLIDKGRVVANHISHIAGATIDEVISHTYNISYQEAVTYKHENAFFLTDSQLEEVEPEQKNFGLVMKQAFTPLINELRRWEVGLRVKHGREIQKYVLTGGSANIDNIDNFLSGPLGFPVEKFNPYHNLDYDLLGVDEAMHNSMALCHVMSIAQSSKHTAPNLLHSDFQGEYSESIPLHSSVFVATRVALLCLIIATGLFIERIFINQDISTVDQVAIAHLQASDINLPRQIRDLYRTRPERVLSELQRQQNNHQQNYLALRELSENRTMAEFFNFQQKIPPISEVNLKRLVVNSSFVEALFFSEDMTKLNDLRERLYGLRYTDATIYLDDRNKHVEFSYHLN